MTTTTIDPVDVPQYASGLLLDWICAGEKEGTVIEPVWGVLVRSGEYEKAHDGTRAYLIAMEFMEFSATGVQKHVGVWAASGEQPYYGSIRTIDETAKACTSWPEATAR
jgi:hypothetical protein